MDAPIQLGLLHLGNRPVERTLEVARLAEEREYDYLWIPDERFFREVYGLCAAVAGVTQHIQIGPCVTDPYTRHPVLTAMAIATLDEISEGRAALGIGAGISGFAELGIDHHRPAKTTAEAIQLVRQLLEYGEAEFDGEALSFTGSLNFRPYREDLLIYLAAGGPLMLQTAGALADGVIIEACVAPGTLEQALVPITRGALSTNRDPEMIDIAARIDIAVDESLDAAYNALRPRAARKLLSASPDFANFAARGLAVPDELRELVAGIGYTWDPEVVARVSEHVPNEYVDAFAIAATPETLGGHLDRLVERGATQITVNPVPVSGDAVEAAINAAAAWREGRG